MALLTVGVPSASATVLMTEDIPAFGSKSYGQEMAEIGYSVADHMGAKMVRYHRGFEPGFDFDSQVDGFVSDAIRRGFQPYLTLTYQPGTWSSPPTPATFGAWCGHVADRYDGRVFHYSVWNEPNYASVGNLSPTTYNSLYRACYAAIKAENPQAKVYYGEIAASSTAACDYVTYSLSPGNPTLADGLAIHTYQWTTPPATQLPGAANLCRGIGRLGDWQSVLNFWWQDGDRLKTPQGGKVPLLVTEHGYCTMEGECPPTSGTANRLFEATRAAYAKQAFQLAEANGVQVFSYYHLFNQTGSASNPSLWDTGILSQSGIPAPSVEALRQAVGAQAPPALRDLSVVLNDGPDPYKRYMRTGPTVQTPRADGDAAWDMADWNGDGKEDLFMVLHDNSSSGDTEVHILDGAANYQQHLLQVVTAEPTHPHDNASWDVADANGDGKQDLFLIRNDNTASGMAEVHVLDGATDFQSYIGHYATAQPMRIHADADWRVADANGDGKQDVYQVLHANTASTKTEVHILNGASNYSSFLGHYATAESTVSHANASWKVADANRDGKPDVIKVLHSGATGSGMTEVHILNAAANYLTYVGQYATSEQLRPDTDAAWVMTDHDRNGFRDLAMVLHGGPNVGANTQLRVLNGITRTGSGMTEVHTLSGVTDYRTYTTHAVTAQTLRPDANAAWDMADANGDGKQDLFMILHDGSTGSGKVEVHILNGATSYSTHLGQYATQTSLRSHANSAWDVADANGDGKQDVFMILNAGTGSGMTEVHILNGATNYASYLGQYATAQPMRVHADADWQVADANGDGKQDVYQVLHDNTASGKVELHILSGASNYSTFLGHYATALSTRDHDDAAWDVADTNGDGKPDLFMVQHDGSTGTGRTEVHILGATGGYQQFIGQYSTVDPLRPDGDAAWATM